jgi:hypothetical protein
VALPSGKAIVVTSVMPMFFPNGDHVLVMNCETDISIDDHVALRKEVDEIWDIFRLDVERAKMNMVTFPKNGGRGGGRA